MLTQLRIGDLAGLLDGEGQVSIVKNRRTDGKRKRAYSLRAEVRVSQRRRILLDTIASWVGKDGTSIGRTGQNGAYYVLRFHSAWLRANLRKIIPHLIIKRRQAEVVMRFLSQPARVGRNGVGDAEWEIRDALHAEIKALNADRTNGDT